MPESPSLSRSLRKRLIWVAGLLIACLAAAWLWKGRSTLPAGLTQQDYESAVEKFQELYRRRGTRIEVLSLAGEIAVSENRLTTATACFRAIPSTDPVFGASARLQEGQVLLRLNLADAAETRLREFLVRAARDRSVPDAHVLAGRKQLNYLLSVELRLEDRRVILNSLHAAGQANVFDSKQFFFPHLLLWHSSTGRRRLTEWLAEDPQNRQLRLAEGRYLTAEGRLEEARRWLEDFYADDACSPGSAAALLEVLFESDDWERFGSIVSKLDTYDEDEPWLLTRMRGEFALHEKRWDDAVVDWQHLLERDPANPWAHTGLARAYTGLNRLPERDQEQHRSLILSRIRVGLVNVTEEDSKASNELAQQCEEIGFDAAAVAFRLHSQRIQYAQNLRGGQSFP